MKLNNTEKENKRLTSKDAAHLANQYPCKLADKMLEDIKIWAAEGKFNKIYPDHIDTRVAKILKELGYHVELTTREDIAGCVKKITYVSWEER